MSYRRRRGLGGKETGGGADPGASRRRILISGATVFGALVIGYALAALWLFPGEASAGDAAVVRVPDVVGLEEREARARVVEAGLEFSVAGGMNHRRAPEGSVLSQNPLPGQFARPGAPVEAVLSRGPETHTLPDVAGLTERQATIVLERLGFEVAVERRENPIPAGRAVETRPVAGTELVVPARLLLVVSEGAPIVVVPDLRGLHIDDAIQILADASLDLGSVSYDPRAVQAPGRVVGQYPPEGYNLRAGDSVELRVAGERERIDEGRGTVRDTRDGSDARAGEESELL